MYRKPVLEQHKRVWLDKESHKKLRFLKKTEEQSMAQIIKDLILKKYLESIPTFNLAPKKNKNQFSITKKGDLSGVFDGL